MVRQVRHNHSGDPGHRLAANPPSAANRGVTRWSYLVNCHRNPGVTVIPVGCVQKASGHIRALWKTASTSTRSPMTL
jgi:hypothetical protein